MKTKNMPQSAKKLNETLFNKTVLMYSAAQSFFSFPFFALSKMSLSLVKLINKVVLI